MEMINLNASARETGKAKNLQLRKEGKIPAVIYGGEDNLNIAVNAREFDNKFSIISENSLIDLNVDGKNFSVLIKEYQKDWMRNKMVHIDFMEITKGKELKTHVPVKIIGAGQSVGERAGGLLEVYLHELEVACLPKDIPSDIQIDVAKLGLGEGIHVSDLDLRGGVRILNSPDTLITVIEHAKEVSLDPDVTENIESEDGVEASGAEKSETE